jgi:sulfur-oxidizing protein SoxA
MRSLVAILTLGLASVLPLHAQDIEPQNRLSGFEMMGAEAQAMQRDDFSNPAMLAVREGEQLWSRAPAEGKASCQACHQDVATSMKGVAARYPAFDAASNGPIDLAGRIQQCQSERQGVPSVPRESAPLLALQAIVALQSRGMPIVASADPRLAEAGARGRALFNQRLGQLDLSCAQCHNQNWGKSLGGTRIPQGHPTGYPIFRMEWQAVGSLQRRLRNCLTGVRAEPFAPGSKELVEIELYLMQRAAGMAMDAPAVRP